MKEVNIDELVDFICECEEYMYNWINCYDNHYHYVDHSKWHDAFLIIFQQYHFDLSKIKEDIKKGKIIFPTYKETNPKILALNDKIIAIHKEKVKEFENKYNIY